MIEFRRIEIENFGPYRGINHIDFSSRTGVWVAYGANGRGKTSLLNAFRYALYGRVEGRVGPIPVDRMVNEIAREAGEATGFRVTLDFTLGGTEEWEVTRTYEMGRSPGEALRVSKAGYVLSREAAQEAVAAVAPPELSGFFLFDAEDLRKYEMLLDQDGDAVANLRAAIERVLGIPFLMRASASVSEVNDQAMKLIAEHLKKDNHTRAAGESLAEAQGIKTQLLEERQKERSALIQLQERLTRVEEDLRQHQVSARVVAKLESERALLDQLKGQMRTATDDLKEVTPALWKVVLRSSCERVLAALESQISPLRARADAATASRHLLQKLEESDEVCPYCTQGLDAERERAVRDLLIATDISAEERASLGRLEADAKILGAMTRGEPSKVLAERARRLDEKRLDYRECQERIDELNEQLEAIGITEAEVNSRNRERNDLIIQESNLKKRIDEIEERIQGQEAAITKLRKKVQNAPNPLDPAVAELERISQGLKSLFNKTAETYRERMRKEVEVKAGEIFLAIRTEEEYKGLRINDGYGLSIVDEAGKEIPNRSAGYEHLVALALLGALQSFSPNRGPIVVDSPFGRLDPLNTERVMKALPEIANQAVLLVFEGEFDRDVAVRALQEHLVEEMQLKRISARETEIAKR